MSGEQSSVASCALQRRVCAVGCETWVLVFAYGVDAADMVLTNDGDGHAVSTGLDDVADALDVVKRCFGGLHGCEQNDACFGVMLHEKFTSVAHGFGKRYDGRGFARGDERLVVDERFFCR